MKKQISLKAKAAFKNLKKYLMDFDEPKPLPSTVGFSNMALLRNSLKNELPYQAFDDDNHLIFLDENDEISVGFGFLINPMLIQGDAAAESINGFMAKMPVGSVLTTMIYSTPVVGYYLDRWEASKNQRKSVMSTKLVEKRKSFLEGGAFNYSLTSQNRMYSRDCFHLFMVRVPFTGDFGVEADIDEFMDKVLDLQGVAAGNLNAAGLSPQKMDSSSTHYLLWHMLNPQKVLKDQRAYAKYFSGGKPSFNDFIHKTTRIRVTSKSSLIFSDGLEEKEDGTIDKKDEIEVVPMTVDEYPDFLTPQMAGSLIGELAEKDLRISAPYILYSNIEVVHAEKARKNVSWKKFLIQKQLVSESDFAKNNFAEMFRRRDDATNFLSESKGKNRPVRMMTGINIFTTTQKRNLDIEEVEDIFKRQGYRVSIEPFIGLPVFLGSLPFCYNPKMDLPNAGIQRSQMVTSFNAACSSHVSGEWKGTSVINNAKDGDPPEGGGMMMVGPKGQLGAIDVYNSESNFNGIVIGTSGAGKSFYLAEMAADTFCRDGVVRIVDVGRSFYNLCENLGGQNVVFDISDPISLNPFWGIADKPTFDKLAEFWRDLLVVMAYPGGRSSESWEFRFIQEAVSKSWMEYGETLELPKIVETMKVLNKENFDDDERGMDVVYQMSPYADPKGIFYPWFVGPCELEMSNDFMVFELDELNVAPELKAIVLMMITNQIERELYLSDRTRWRLTIIDEAYDLLYDLRVGRVIEYLFRKSRKYKGSCAIGTQSFADLYHNDATKGIIANSGWKHVLKQDGSSAKKAFDEEVIEDNEFMRKLVSGIKPGADYGEIFIKSPNNFDVMYRLVTDPYSFYTYSSKDMAKVQRIAKEKMSVDKGLVWADAIALAIEQLSDEMLQAKINGS